MGEKSKLIVIPMPLVGEIQKYLKRDFSSVMAPRNDLVFFVISSVARNLKRIEEEISQSLRSFEMTLNTFLHKRLDRVLFIIE